MSDRQLSHVEINGAIAKALGLSLDGLIAVDIELQPQAFPIVRAKYRVREEDGLVEILKTFSFQEESAVRRIPVPGSGGLIDVTGVAEKFQYLERADLGKTP